jgi:FG-GAP-like repeat
LYISSFGEDETGELYVMGLDGTVHRLAAGPGVRQPRDFDASNTTDVLWRHSCGVIDVWLTDGGRISSTGSPGSVVSAWTIQGVGDFNGDGKDDILWRHSAGLVAIWFMSGGNIIGAADLPSVVSAWTIQGVGDFNGDGKDDILWRHSAGAVAIWFMNGGNIIGAGRPSQPRVGLGNPLTLANERPSVLGLSLG